MKGAKLALIVAVGVDAMKSRWIVIAKVHVKANVSWGHTTSCVGPSVERSDLRGCLGVHWMSLPRKRIGITITPSASRHLKQLAVNLQFAVIALSGRQRRFLQRFRPRTPPKRTTSFG
jgi:hypothetical protein